MKLIKFKTLLKMFTFFVLLSGCGNLPNPLIDQVKKHEIDAALQLGRKSPDQMKSI